MLELWLIRHGETDGNARQLIHGITDTPLNERGLRQAARLATRLSGTRFDAVYASDLQRAHRTATTALPDAEVRFDPRLREMSYGIFEDRTWEELDADETAQAHYWREDPVTRRVPGGESYGDLWDRLEAFRADLPDSGRVAAFTHGGAIRVVLYGVLGRTNRDGLRFSVANTSITRLRFRPDGVTIVTLNDHAHLDETAAIG